MARKSKLDKPEEEKTFFFEDEKEDKNVSVKIVVQRGIIRLITKNYLIIEYGSGLGANISFDPDKHSHLKVNDEIEFSWEENGGY